MTHQSNNKIYGLILPKNGQAQGIKSAAAAFNVFGDESDEEEKAQVPVAPYGQGKSSSKMKRQTQMDIDKALMEDPSVYEYDEIYDSMQAQKPKAGAKEKESSTRDRKPRYISGLLKAAEAKKREDERRKERQVQKEREAEGSKYADKESFVTSAYKKKMLEMQAEEERERQEAAMEALTDVTKQKDMSGFYRYLYRQTTGEEVKKEPFGASEGDKSRLGDRMKPKAEDVEAKVKEEPASPPSQAGAKKCSQSASSSGSASPDSESDQAASEVAHNRGKFAQRHNSHTSSNFRKKRADSTSDSNSASEEHRDKSLNTDGRSRDNSRRGNKSSASRKSPSKSHSRSPASQHRSAKSSDDKRKRKRLHPSSPDGEKSSSVSEEQARRSHKMRDRSNDRSESKSRRVRSDADESPVSDNELSKAEHKQVSDDLEDNLKEMRKRNADAMMRQGKENKKADVDPVKKVYPHHNSAKDIEEARKRYLQRKLAREKAKFA